MAKLLTIMSGCVNKQYLVLTFERRKFDALLNPKF